MAQPTRIAAALLLAVAGIGGGAVLADGPAPTALPKDFRSWTHVRSMVVTDPEEGMYGFHNVYANAPALKTLRSGKTPVAFPDGATFVVSIFEVKQEKGLVVAGEKQRDVMQVKDAKAKATGGWRFASFDPSGKPIAIDATSCAACHAQASATDMVFTRYVR